MDPVIRAFLAEVVAVADARAAWEDQQRAATGQDAADLPVTWTTSRVEGSWVWVEVLETGRTQGFQCASPQEAQALAARGEAVGSEDWSDAAARQFPEPPVPDGWPEFLFDDLEPEQIRAWLGAHPAPVAG